MSASAQRLHNALARLEQLDYRPIDLIKDLLASTDDVCAQARDDLRAGAMDIVITLLAGTHTPFRGALWCLRMLNVSPGLFMVDLAGCSDEEIITAVAGVLPALMTALQRRHADSVREWAILLGLQLYGTEISTITRKNFGFHATVTKLQPAQVEHFDLSDLAQKLRSGAPRLWELVSHLLSAAVDRRRTPMTAESRTNAALVLSRRGDLGAHDDLVEVESQSAARNGRDSPGEAPTVESSVDQDAQELVQPQLAPVGQQARPSAAAIRNSATHEIKMLTVFGIIQHANNQQCNAIPMNMGTFLRMMHVPDAVFGVLHHAGVTVSSSSMDLAVDSLSEAEEKRMRLRGSSRTSQAAFDNFNFMERVAVPTAGRDNVFHSAIAALHLSSPPTLTSEHFRFADLTWETNPAIKIPRMPGQKSPFHPSFMQILEMPRLLDARFADGSDPTARPSPDGPSHLLSSHAFYIRRILVKHHALFSGYQDLLGDPDIVQRVAPHKTEWDPLRAMDLNQSHVADTIEALSRILRSMGITREVTKDYVTFVHGDLGGSERVQSAQLYRSIEPDELDRLKGVVDVPGLFHVMMASEDSVFRLHCLPAESRKDPSSLFEYIKVILPNRADHGKFASSSSGPTYRMAHDAFTHVLWALVFDAWARAAAAWKAECTSLELFAETLSKLPREQAWSTIRRLSFTIAETYAAGPLFYQQRRKPPAERDKIFENWQLFVSHMLLHHDLVYSIKIQDVGRVCLALWSLMFVFPAAGKHKYAAHSQRVLANIAYVYPNPLREAFLQSWIINPSGKPEGGRGVDWLVELYNLYIKVIHSGASSNFGMDQIIKVSPLVKLYKTVFNNFMFNYHLIGRTVRHAPPNMAETLERLGRRIQSDGALEFKPGRTAEFEVKDATAEGQHMFMTGKVGNNDSASDKPVIIDVDDFEIDF